MIRASLSLERSGTASVVRTTEGSANTRRIDQLADFREVMEKNAREAHEEREEAEQLK